MGSSLVDLVVYERNLRPSCFYTGRETRPRGIDVGLFTISAVEVAWVRSHVDDPHPNDPTRTLFSRDCPIYHLRVPGGAELFLLLNHLKSQSHTGGNPDTLRRLQAQRVRQIYNELRAEGAELVAVLGDLNKGPDKTNPAHHPSLEALLDPGTPLVSAYGLPSFSQLFGDKDTDRERPGSFQSCTLENRLDYLLLSPELATKVTDGGVFRKGLWGPPKNKTKPKLWSIYPEITTSRHAAPAAPHAPGWHLQCAARAASSTAAVSRRGTGWWARWDKARPRRRSARCPGPGRTP